MNEKVDKLLEDSASPLSKGLSVLQNLKPSADIKKVKLITISRSVISKDDRFITVLTEDGKSDVFDLTDDTVKSQIGDFVFKHFKDK